MAQFGDCFHSALQQMVWHFPQGALLVNTSVTLLFVHSDGFPHIPNWLFLNVTSVSNKNCPWVQPLIPTFSLS